MLQQRKAVIGGIKMEKFLKKAGWTSILTSLVLAVIGIVMIYNPQTTMQFISTILGIFFIVMGIIKLINYFVTKGNSSLFTNDIAWGIISIIIGLVVIVYSSTIENIFRIMIGIWIIYSGFTRLNLSFKLRSVSQKVWTFVLILSVLMIIGGLYVTFYPGALIVTLGVIILIYSIMDIIEGFIFMRNIKELN